MPFVHVAGITPAAAPDEVVDWFTTFQTWMVGMGWTVVAGGGTQDITFRSVGEAGGLTMLYIRAWRDGVFVNRVNFRVQDDLAGTHTTTPAAGAYVDTGGVQFSYWMSGDMDAIIVAFNLAGGYRHVYAGLVIPFALTVPDETYRMIVAIDIANATILRNHTGVWDVDSTVYVSPYMGDSRISPFDGSFSPAGTYFGDNDEIAGQLSHISGQIQDPGINAADTIETGRPGATTSWIVLSDRLGLRFAVRTGGVLPTGIPDGAYASVAGAAAGFAALYNAIAAFAVGRGWADLGDPGLPGPILDARLLYSTGESGLEEIYVLFARDFGQFIIMVQDDAVGTHRTDIGLYQPIPGGGFPANYWICGDRDCIVLVVQRVGYYMLWWGGLVSAFPGGLLPPYAGATLSEYSVVAGCRGTGTGDARMLRAHDGTWTPFPTVAHAYSDGVNMTNSNPNAFDGTTYLVWPVVAYLMIGADYGPHGQMKYFFESDGGGIANLDTITVGARVYTVFFDGDVPPKAFVVRTT